MRLNLIGISGKTGSGKDTVGKIIQYLTDKNAKEMSFKDWYASNVYSVYQVMGKYKIQKFATKLKQIASLLTGIPIEKFEDQEFKKTFLGEQWRVYKNLNTGKQGIENIRSEHSAETYLMAVREFLQKLGTEAMRDVIHPNVWVNALFADYKHTKKFYNEEGEQLRMKGLPDWIITDMRFPNELQAIKERNGIVIRVNRDLIIGENDYGYTKVSINKAEKDGIINPQHSSETALDNAEFDYTITNDGSIEDLITTVQKTLNPIL